MTYFFYFPLIFYFLSILRFVFSCFITRILFSFSFVSLLILTGTRWFAGADFEGYYGIYQEVPLLSDFSPESTKHIYGEIGYLFFASLFKTFGFHFSIFVFLLTFLSLTLKYYLFSRFFLGYIAFSIYLFISFVSVEFIELRWSVSISFIALGFYHGLISRKYIFATVLLLSSLVFHYYSILFIFIFIFILLVRPVFCYYLFFIFSFIFSFYVLLFGFGFSIEGGSELYVFQRFLRYLNEPDSKVGIFSLAKVFYFLFFYILMNFFSRPVCFCGVEKNILKCFLLTYSIALAFSFVPVFYFRASAVGDIFGLLLIFMCLRRVVSVSDRLIFVFLFSMSFILWFIIDLSNSFQAERLYEYSSSLKLLL